MTVFTGMIIKIIYFFEALIIWGVSFYFFSGSGIPSSISSILSLLIFIVCLAIFFPKIKDVLGAVVREIGKLMGHS
ncbi:MAG: hypothetical protein QG670_2740 [Thermoproteota archaeon]|nr:hypothetical protein [Thermoproteota archaeon]